MLLDFKDKVVVITGAEQGIGKAAAEAFARQNAKVIAVGIQDEKGEQVVEEIKVNEGEASYVHTDVTKEEEVNELPGKILDIYGPADVLVNNAAVITSGDLLNTSTEDWDKNFDVNIRGMFLVTKALLPDMIDNGGGVIVCIASECAEQTPRELAAYNCTKGATVSFIQSLAVDFADQNIRANAVSPGTTATEMALTLPEHQLKQLRESRPLGRLGEPEELAKFSLVAASEDIGYATGSVFNIDGGSTAQLFSPQK